MSRKQTRTLSFLVKRVHVLDAGACFLCFPSRVLPPRGLLLIAERSVMCWVMILMVSSLRAALYLGAVAETLRNVRGSCGGFFSLCRSKWAEISSFFGCDWLVWALIVSVFKTEVQRIAPAVLLRWPLTCRADITCRKTQPNQTRSMFSSCSYVVVYWKTLFCGWAASCFMKLWMCFAEFVGLFHASWTDQKHLFGFFFL